MNQKKTTKGVNRDLINFKNILGKYTEFDQKMFDENKNKNGIDISTLLLNEKYVANILFETEKVNKKRIYQICLDIRKSEKNS